MSNLELLATPAQLKQFCAIAKQCPFVTIDTEFIRDNTYYPKLCLLQMAILTERYNHIALFDPLSPQFDLSPIVDLFSTESTVKVFHAARQDLELFYHRLGIFPQPIFDTQIAAMACGYQGQVSYQTLVQDIRNLSLDNSSKLTDWSRRPLSERQLRYAASDVDHLRYIFLELNRRLKKLGRKQWIDEEVAQLTDQKCYLVDHYDMWLRIKFRKGSLLFCAVLCELAKFRETIAQECDLPRQWIMRDQAILEIASNLPTKVSQLKRLRFLKQSKQWTRVCSGILESIRIARQRVTTKDFVQKAAKIPVEKYDISLMRVLLKSKAEEHGVAEQLIANADDLQEVALGNPRAQPLNGWRRDLFGEDALRLCDGKAALTVQNGKVTLLNVKG